jgi:hypothetical protein
VLLFGLAAAYFTIGAPLTFEWIDEGQIAYPSWRVAVGEVAYRDFRHFYWPSLFLLNATLLRLFGTDLLVLRLGLAGLKAVIVLLVYRLARHLARRPFALGVAFLCVTVFGSPYWLFNTPYATYHTAACAFLGMLVLLGGPAGPARCFTAGLCFGLGVTFRQSTGTFAVAGALLSLAVVAPRVGDARRGWRRALVATVLVAAAGVPLVYVLRPPLTVTGLVLGAPWAASVLGVLVSGTAAISWTAVLSFLGGAMLPPLSWILFYVRLDALGAMLHDTITTLPRAITWFAPLAMPPLHLLLTLGAATSLLATLALPDEPRSRRAAALGLAVVLGAMRAGFAIWGRAALGADLLPLLLWLPILATASSGAILWRLRWRLGSDAQRALALVHWYSCAALVGLYPGADTAHAAQLLPVCLPAVAYVADRVHARATGVGRGLLTGLALTALLVACAASPMITLARTAAARPPESGLPRGTLIWQRDPRLAATARVVGILDTLAAPGAPVLLLPSEQITYFLAGRPSALQHEELVLYLVAIGYIRPEDARALAPESAMIARLDATRPVVVRWLDGPGMGRFRSVFPAVAEWIDAHYHTQSTVGRYEVLTR